MKKWFKNISYSLLGKVIAMLFLVLLDVIAARMLGVEDYAEWVFFFSILTMMFYVGWFGINTSAKVFISKCSDDKEKANCLVASVVLRIVVSVAVSTILILIMPRIAGRLGYPGKYPNLKWLLCFASILVFLNSFTEFFKALFIGMNNFTQLFLITIVEYMGYFTFSWIILNQSKCVKSIAFGYAIAGFVVGVIGWTILLKDNKNFYKFIDKNFLKNILPIFKYAIPIAFISLGGMILVEMDTFMLGVMTTKESVAMYSIAKNLTSKATHINYALTVGVMTSFSVITAQNREKKKNEFRKAIKLNLIITIGVSICFLLFADIAINILYGSSYRQASGLIRLLVVYYALYGISNFFSTFLDFRKKAGIRSICYSSVFIINLILNYLWIPISGVYGAALATDLSLVPYTIFVIIQTRKEWKTETDN